MPVSPTVAVRNQRRVYCNKLSHSFLSFLLRLLHERKAFLVIQISRCTFFPCHAQPVLWWAAIESAILEIPMKLPQAIPNSLCCFTLVTLSLSLSFRTGGPSNFLIESGLYPAHYNAGQNMHATVIPFVIPAPYLHIYLLYVSSCSPALLFQDSCLQSYVGKILLYGMSLPRMTSSEW